MAIHKWQLYTTRTLCLLSPLLALGCSPYSPTTRTIAEISQTSSPSETTFTTLASFGAKGDGISDDTEALRKAFASGDERCLDGENKTYLVRGTLRANNSLCLKNTSFVQALSEFDTRPYILSSQTQPAPLLDPTETIFYPEDPVLSDADHTALEERNNLRTILVTANGKSTVDLENIKINKGLFETLGNGGNAAAIYIAEAVSVKMKNIEIFGKGRGYGISLQESHNILIDQLNIHDITWTLTSGDRPLSLNELSATWGWNNLPVYVYAPQQKKFSVVRSQEQTSGLVIANCTNVEVTNSRISKLLFRLEDTLLPWQADGITVAATEGLRINAMSIEHTWEGIDISGGDGPDQGVRNFTLSDFDIQNSFAYGFKVVHGAHNGFVTNSTVSYSGMVGVTSASPASSLTFEGLTISETGLLNLTDGSVLRPWGASIRAGIRVAHDFDNGITPAQHIHILNSNIINSSSDNMYGVLVDPGIVHAVVENLIVTGATVEGVRGEDRESVYTFHETASAYKAVFATDGALADLICLWDQSHGSIREPVLFISDLSSFLETQKQNGSQNDLCHAVQSYQP